MFGIPYIDRVFSKIKPSLYDDIVDRLNCYITSLILIFFAILVSAKQYIGKPIQCWVPAQFRGGWEQYAEDYCFVKNTYFVPFDTEIPSETTSRGDQEIGYYQWVPVLLALQAAMFCVPHLVWKCLNGLSGINLKAIVKSAASVAVMEPDDRNGAMKKVCRYLNDSLTHQRKKTLQGIPSGPACLRFCGASYGSYMTHLYMFVKVLYLLNVIAQFFLLNAYLGTSYTFWGVEILSDLFNGREWMDSGHFPRVTLCDFNVRVLGNLHRHTVQCVLMINMFSEKIYLFLWFWLLFVACATALNLIYWFFNSYVPAKRESVVTKFLRVYSESEYSIADQLTIRRFINHALRPDGVLVLRFVSAHAGEMHAVELTAQLLKCYLKEVATLPRTESTKGSPHSRISNVSEDGGRPGSQRGLNGSDGGVGELLYPTHDEKAALRRHHHHDSPGGIDQEASLLPTAPMATENGGGRILRQGGYPGPPPALITPKWNGHSGV